MGREPCTKQPRRHPAFTRIATRGSWLAHGKHRTSGAEADLAQSRPPIVLESSAPLRGRLRDFNVDIFNAVAVCTLTCLPASAAANVSYRGCRPTLHRVAAYRSRFGGTASKDVAIRFDALSIIGHNYARIVQLKL